MGIRRVRSAFTLLEVLLVLAIIVLVTALALPSLEAMSDYFKLSGCIDTVRGAWVLARAQAIENSRPYRFAVAGGRFRIAPDSDDYWPTAPANDDNPGFVHEGILPGGFQFRDNGKIAPAAKGSVEDEEKLIGTPADWNNIVVFLPDGTALQDVDFVFPLSPTKTRTLRLRALTGTIEVINDGEENH